MKNGEKRKSYPIVEYKVRPDDPAYKANKKAEFIREFTEYGTITATCEAIHISHDSVENWLKSDPEFAAAFEQADRVINDKLIKRGIEWAMTGKDPSAANLLKFFLACRDMRYRQRIVQEIDPKTVDFIVSSFVEAIRQNVPEFCPSCKTHLSFTNEIARELGELSSKFLGNGNQP